MADPFVLVPVPDPMLGAVIDRFIVVELLGRGGMGAVYLARHEAAAHIQCVIKTMLAHLANNALMISRFKTETEAVSRLKHDNIVKLENFGVLPDGQMFMRFEFIEGLPLDRYLSQHDGRISLHRALYLVFQVCDALDHAHSVGVVHRDLKPDNLLIKLDASARVPQLVKVVDFGISKIVRSDGSDTASNIAMGTPHYMSVEQYDNAASASSKSDVYSLAIMLWLMLTGELPWGKAAPGVLYHLQRTVVPKAPPEIPPGVADVLLQCLSVDPEYRPTMRDFAILLASEVPGTERAPSGGEILMDIVPRFAVASTDETRTVKRPVVGMDRVAAQLWPQTPTQGPRDVYARTVGALAVMTGPAPAAQDAGTANAPAVASPAPEVVQDHDCRSEAGASSAAKVLPTRATERPRIPASSLVTLPEGLNSQRFASQPDPDAGLAYPRESSEVVSAEIELAEGTPSPHPYAHAEVPAVVVSSTQLSEPSKRADVKREPEVEPVPMMRLPQPARPRRAAVLLGVGACLLASAVSFVAIRSGLRSDAPQSSTPPLSSQPVPSTASVTPPPTQRRSNTEPRQLQQVQAPAAAPTVPASIDAPTTQLEPVTFPPEAKAAQVVPTKTTTTAASKSTAVIQAPRADGELVVYVQPWAAVWINGKAIPDGTPYRVKVPAGRYRVRLVNDDIGRNETLVVTVEPHKTMTIERKWL